MLDYEAVQLFLEHATLAQPGYTPKPDDLAAIGHICQRLDGMPLAIEMAAVQTVDMGVQSVASGLDDRFALLTDGSRTALPHHQTLHAAIEWSYQLLSETEQTLLSRLSVFAGGWTIAAAKSVCADTGTVAPPSLSGPSLDTSLDSSGRLPRDGAGGFGPNDVVPLLLQLVRKSLVATAPQDAMGGVRYRLLETVRQFANEKLRERGEVEALRDRHLACCLSLAEEMTDIGGQHFEAWVGRIDREYDNLRAAFVWASTHHDRGERSLRLVAALGPYWFYRSHIGEGMDWVDNALAHSRTAPAFARARALKAKAGLYIQQGDMVQAIRLGEASLALFRQTDDRLGMAWCLELLVNNLNNARSQVLAKEALPLFRELGSRDGEARVLRGLGNAAYRSGDHVRATQFLEQTLAIAREVEDSWEISACLDSLFDANPSRALDLCAQEWARLKENGDEPHSAALLQTYGVLLLARGEYERARPVLEESVQWWQRTDSVSYPGPAQAPGRSASVQQERPTDVALFCSSAFFNTLTALGFAELSLDHVDQAIACLDRSHKLSRESGEILTSHDAQFLMASARIAQGNLALAADDARECLQRFHKYGYRSRVVCSLVQMADLAHLRGDMRYACRLLGVARAFGHELDATNSWEGRITWCWHRDAKRTIVEPVLAAARAQLGDAEFEATYAAGQHMTLDQAVEYALAGG
jgi:tetratricopeptide (TPR) repeat protein